MESGENVENETRNFDYNSKTTVPMRDKEAKQDYRFMPEPNLPPLRVSENEISRARESLPQLPAKTREFLVAKYKLSHVSAAQLVAWPRLLQYYEECIKHDPINCQEIASLIFSVVQHQCLTLNCEPQDRVATKFFKEFRHFLNIVDYL